MSDTGTPLDTGYSTPVPELDDHRHQSATIPRSRSRRGTVDTVHSVNLRSPDLGFVNDRLLGATIARDFEEAIVDEDGNSHSHSPSHRPSRTEPRPRRGTIDTINTRSDSPPNSVKAFAEARRQERGNSNVAGPPPAIVVSDGANVDSNDLHRAQSFASRNGANRRYGKDNDGRSIKSFRTFSSVESEAEEDVCFPLHDAPSSDSLSIDFDILEEFIAEEEIREATRGPLEPTRTFHEENSKVDATYFTSDGDPVNLPVMQSDASSIGEKSKRTVTVGFDRIADSQRAAENRFEFFSSHGESTIHAADLGDLVLPGDDIRTLFTHPDEKNDEGVWWLNMNSPTTEEIKIICKAFGVHPLTIEDITTHEAREKIELFSSYYFACFRSFRVEEHESGPDYEGFNIYVIVFREGTLSFSFSPNNHAANVRRRLAVLKDYVSLSSDWLCYAMV